MEPCNRPSRSDAHLSKEEEAKMEGATRDYFDGLAPKRHTKPQRSEYATQYVDALPGDQDNGVIPEYIEFQQLEQNPQKVVYAGSEVTDEFVETEYYKDLNGVDKQHHTFKNEKLQGEPSYLPFFCLKSSVLVKNDGLFATENQTGTGFIKVENTNGAAFNFGPESESAYHASCKGNPATNEWTPAPVDTASFVSNKPHRSDN